MSWLWNILVAVGWLWIGFRILTAVGRQYEGWERWFLGGAVVLAVGTIVIQVLELS